MVIRRASARAAASARALAKRRYDVDLHSIVKSRVPMPLRRRGVGKCKHVFAVTIHLGVPPPLRRRGVGNWRLRFAFKFVQAVPHLLAEVGLATLPILRCVGARSPISSEVGLARSTCGGVTCVPMRAVLGTSSRTEPGEQMALYQTSATSRPKARRPAAGVAGALLLARSSVVREILRDIKKPLDALRSPA